MTYHALNPNRHDMSLFRCKEAVFRQRLEYEFPLALAINILMRNFINIVEGYHDYPSVLRDAREIAEYIVSTSKTYVDEEFIEEHFHGCSAHLQLVPITDIQEGNPDANIRSSAKEKRYAKMNPATIPPLVIENGEIEDGNHRYRVAVANGATHLWCYVVSD